MFETEPVEPVILYKINRIMPPQEKNFSVCNITPKISIIALRMQYNVAHESDVSGLND